jgi:hypothetical protein
VLIQQYQLWRNYLDVGWHLHGFYDTEAFARKAAPTGYGWDWRIVVVEVIHP